MLGSRVREDRGLAVVLWLRASERDQSLTMSGGFWETMQQVAELGLLHAHYQETLLTCTKTYSTTLRQTAQSRTSYGTGWLLTATPPLEDPFVFPYHPPLNILSWSMQAKITVTTALYLASIYVSIHLLLITGQYELILGELVVSTV